MSSAALALETMSFLDHLEELRKRLLWSLVGVAVAFGLCWIFAADLYVLASAPIRSNPAVTLAVFRPQDIFGLHFKVTLVALPGRVDMVDAIEPRSPEDVRLRYLLCER